MIERIDELLSEWTAAERAGDAEKLGALLTDDFSGAGPLGFVLTRPAWLGRHRQGLTYEHFVLDEIRVRRYGDVAVVTARNDTRGRYQGHPLPEAVRSTLVIARGPEGWRLAAIHMSFIAGTPGSPPTRVPTDPTRSGARGHTRREV